MIRRLTLLALAAALLGSAPLFAQDTASPTAEDPAPAGLAGHPWYVAPMASFTFADQDRGTKDGIGGTLAAGRMFTDSLALEVSGFYTKLKPETGNGSDATITGGGLNVLLFPVKRFPNIFGLVGVNYGQVKDHPGGFPKYDSTVVDTGIGYVQPVLDWLLVRADARFRMDIHGHDNAGTTADDTSNFYDNVFSVGVMLPFGAEKKSATTEPSELASTNSNDDDNDGVPNDRDQCPGTPAGAVVNENGCEADEDGDGVPNRLDECPGTPAGTVVNEKGCPADADGDGVLWNVDECPNTPAGAHVLSNGCALENDCRTPKAGEQVDEHGCAIERKFVLRGVKFEFDSDRLTEDAKTILVETATTLKESPDIKVELDGHTCNIGTEEYNQGLSDRRARSARKFLTEQGVDGGRMSTKGFGESQPIDTNETEEGRENNRRVELKVIE